MKYLITKLLTLVFLLSALHTTAAEKSIIPPKPNTPRLVNDFAGILTNAQKQYLENKLDSFAQATSTQIAVVTVTDLKGMDPNQFAFEILDKWGIGQKGKDNGVVILIKPKLHRNDRGHIAIQVGYGLESVIPDATAKLIIENEMIPNFRNDDYFKGIWSAIDTIISLAKGEYTAAEYKKKTKKDNGWAGFILLLFIFFFMFLSKKRAVTYGRGRGFIWTMPFFFSGNSGRFDDCSDGNGEFGGFGGFGAVGGGTGGGGGASGSW